MRVASELALAYPELSDELRLNNLELRAGKPRSEALRNMADRSGVDDLSSLVTMLIQTTSSARAWRSRCASIRRRCGRSAGSARKKRPRRPAHGLPARALHLSVDLDRDDGSRRHQVHHRAVPDGGEEQVAHGPSSKKSRYGIHRRRPRERRGDAHGGASLMKRDTFERGEALWIVPSRGVHTMWMRSRSTWWRSTMGPSSSIAFSRSALAVRLPRAGTAGVLELPVGTLEQSVRTRSSDPIGASSRGREPPMSLVAEASVAPATPTPGAPPASLADTVSIGHALPAAAEDAHRRRGQRHRPRRKAAPAVLGARGDGAARARREAGRSARDERDRHRRLSLRADGPRTRSRRPVPGYLPLRRSGARSARAVQRLRSRLHGGAPVHRPRWPGDRFRQPDRQQGDVRQARAGGKLGKSLFLYGAPGNGKTVVAEGIGRALGDECSFRTPRRRRPDHHHVRSSEPRAAHGARNRTRASIAASAFDRRWERIRRPWSSSAAS